MVAVQASAAVAVSAPRFAPRQARGPAARPALPDRFGVSARTAAGRGACVARAASSVRELPDDQRVVITGAGVVSTAGNDRDAFFEDGGTPAPAPSRNTRDAKDDPWSVDDLLEPSEPVERELPDFDDIEDLPEDEED